MKSSVAAAIAITLFTMPVQATAAYVAYYCQGTMDNQEKGQSRQYSNVYLIDFDARTFCTFSAPANRDAVKTPKSCPTARNIKRVDGEAYYFYYNDYIRGYFAAGLEQYHELNYHYVTGNVTTQVFQDCTKL